MRVSIRDSLSFQILQPREVAAYLRAHGWAEVQMIGQRGSVWTLGQNSNEKELLLPLDRNLKDYATRMNEVLRILESVEERSQISIYNDLLTTWGDVVRFRLDTYGAEDGTLFINHAVDVVSSVRDGLLAAACSTISPKPYHHSRYSAGVADFIQKIRLGQTERGSYIVTVISKLCQEGDYEQLLLTGEPAPQFERKVMNTLSRGLEHTKQAAQDTASGKGYETFEEFVPDGVSANLCEAIANMTTDGPGMLDISFSWAVTHPQSPEIRDQIILPSQIMPIIRDAARVLKEVAPMDGYELKGFVIGLDRPRNSEQGTATILSMIEGQMRKVKVSLYELDYHAAISAHQAGDVVTCVGTVIRRRNIWVMEDPRGFRVEQ